MAIATARSLIESRGFDEEHMTQTLTAQFRVAYGDDAARRVFEPDAADDDPDDAAAESGEAAVDGATSFGNGAALRAAPIGLFCGASPERAAEIAARAAWITHAHPLGVDGAALQAAAVAEMLAPVLDAPTALLDRLRKCVRTRWFREYLEKWDALSGSVSTTARLLGNGGAAHQSVPTALYCFLQNPGSFADALLFALSLGGDTSALASMTGALAGARLGASAIPAAWVSRVDCADELTELAGRLLAAADAGAS